MDITNQIHIWVSHVFCIPSTDISRFQFYTPPATSSARTKIFRYGVAWRPRSSTGGTATYAQVRLRLTQDPGCTRELERVGWAGIFCASIVWLRTDQNEEIGRSRNEAKAEQEHEYSNQLIWFTLTFLECEQRGRRQGFRHPHTHTNMGSITSKHGRLHIQRRGL